MSLLVSVLMKEVQAHISNLERDYKKVTLAADLPVRGRRDICLQTPNFTDCSINWAGVRASIGRASACFPN